MSTAVKRTISLPPDLARDAEALAKSEGKTLSAVIQEALREARTRRLQGEFGAVQQFWSERAKELGILTDEDLERHLRS
jgi:predicted transcriptional regulator